MREKKLRNILAAGKSLSAVLPLVMILSVWGMSAALDSRIADTRTGPKSENLHSIDRRVPNQARGRVSYSAKTVDGDVSQLSTRVRISGLPAEISRQYRFWVVDDFVTHCVLVKTFRSDKDGSANFSTSHKLRNVQFFQRAVVTLEQPRFRWERSDGTDRGPIIMEGEQPLAGE